MVHALNQSGNVVFSSQWVIFFLLHLAQTNSQKRIDHQNYIVLFEMFYIIKFQRRYIFILKMEAE